MIKRIPCRSSSHGTVRRDAALADPNQSKAKNRIAESIGQLCPLLFCFMGGIARNRLRGQNLNVLQTSAEMKAGSVRFLAKKFRTAGFRAIIGEKTFIRCKAFAA